MSKLGESISWNRKKKEEYGLGGVDVAKPKSHFGQGLGSSLRGSTPTPLHEEPYI